MTVEDFLNNNLPGWFTKNKEVKRHLSDEVQKSKIEEYRIVIHGKNGFPIEADRKTKRVIKAWVCYNI